MQRNIFNEITNEVYARNLKKWNSKKKIFWKNFVQKIYIGRFLNSSSEKWWDWLQNRLKKQKISRTRGTNCSLDLKKRERLYNPFMQH